MTKLMDPRPSIARGLESGRFQQGPEHTVNFAVHQRLPVVRSENMITTATHLLTMLQVVAQPSQRAVVQWHQSGFLKFGSADQQTVGSDVGDQQLQCL